MNAWEESRGQRGTMTDETHRASRTLPAAPEFSVVITCYYEEDTLDEFHRRLSEAMAGLGRSYEILFVNDGSTDGTFAKLEAIFDKDEHVSVIIDLYKNAGQAAALTAGFVHARGDKFIIIDSDLQLDPEEIPLLIEEADKGYDVVSGCRQTRQDSWVRILFSALHNVVVRRVSGTSLRDFGCSFKIIDARLIRAFEYGPFKPLRPAYTIAKAQRLSEVAVTHHPRSYGQSGWSLSKLFAYAMENLIGMARGMFQVISAGCFVVALVLGLRIGLDLWRPASGASGIDARLVVHVIVLHLFVTAGIVSGVGELVMRNYVLHQREPCYIIRTIRQR